LLPTRPDPGSALREFIKMSEKTRSYEKKYLVVVQCHLVKQRCSGYFCEKAYFERAGLFARYAGEGELRVLYFTCGGCSGRAVHRKLTNLLRQSRRREKLEKKQFIVHLSSCITNDNFHGPPCPHLDYLKDLVCRLNLELVEGTTVNPKAEARRREGIYQPRPGMYDDEFIEETAD
jgi:predicted metal-binding protein